MKASHTWRRGGATFDDENLVSRAGLVVLTAGTYGNVLRFLPPLSISDALLDEGLSILEKALSSV